MANPISSSGVVNGQTVYAQQVLEISRALNGTGSNSIIILGDVKQGSLTNKTNDANSFAQGLATTSSGNYSHAEGQSTVAEGNYSHAEGFGTYAYQDYSHAEGGNSIANGYGSHAEGQSTANGEGAHSEGYNTQANGDYSHAEGYYTIAYSNYQTAVGQYNKDLNSSDYFVVGVGTGVSSADGLGVNATRTYISNSLFLPNLTTVAQDKIVAYSSSGQLYYVASESIRVTNAVTASFVTASNVYGPYGASSILSASYAVSASQAQSSSYALSASYVTGSIFTSINPALSASYALTASYSPGAGAVGSSLTQAAGITVFSYNGASAQTVAVSGAANLTSDLISKWTGTAFANSSLTDNGTTITGVSSIQLTGASSNLSGSFSGSFQGDGTNLTGVTATPVFPSTAITNIASSDKVFVNDGANKHITYLNLLTDLAGTNLSVESSDSLTLASTITGITSISATSFTGSYTGSFTGPLTGTASWAANASQAISSSYAATASFVPLLKSGTVTAASFALVGGEYKYTVTFGTAYSTNNYAISVVGGDPVPWTIESKGASQFTINSNQSSPLTADVYWITTPHNN